MEPMTLGSPGGSPLANPNYLPAFLMGEPQPQARTASPIKGGTSRKLNLSIYNSPDGQQDYNNSLVPQEGLFGNYLCNGSPPRMSKAMSQHTTNISGPPTQGLFDALRPECNNVQSPVRSATLDAFHNQQCYGNFNGNYYNNNQQALQSTIDESCLNYSFNTPPDCNAVLQRYGSVGSLIHKIRSPEFWITIYGFAPSSRAEILHHFAQCGTIVDKVLPAQNANWLHLKFASRMECEKALLFHEKILCNNIMIGVTYCKDKNIIDKENISDDLCNRTPPVRLLTQTIYNNSQKPVSVLPTRAEPQKSTGLMNKAMDLFFGW